MASEYILVAQVIRTQWTKRSRGAPRATRRNAVPERLALPAQSGSLRAGSLVHRVCYGDRNEFQSPVAERLDIYADIQAPRLSPIDLLLEADTMQVRFEGPTPEGPYIDQSQHPTVGAGFMGLPGRLVRRRPVALNPGEWGQIRYMGRHLGWEEPWYEKWAYNIGRFPKISKRIFVDTEPRYHFESMPDVW